MIFNLFASSGLGTSLLLAAGVALVVWLVVTDRTPHP